MSSLTNRPSCQPLLPRSEVVAVCHIKLVKHLLAPGLPLANYVSLRLQQTAPAAGARVLQATGHSARVYLPSFHAPGRWGQYPTRERECFESSHLLYFLVFRSSIQYCRHIIREAELVKRLDDVVARDGLLRFLLRDLVRLRAYEGDKLDAAFYEDIAGFLGERDAGRRRQDFTDDLLDGG